ncbi:MAG TPA: molybdopterin molybdenumtransferase MoeA, partial [Dokdonella sp.]|nr:molybdopterin molybdenumtransferase MoeA [Dokdonella sp.]
MSDFPTMLSVAAARTHVVDFCAQRKPAREVVPLYAAVGRILCDDVIAAADLPPFANSAMDGFALHGVALPAADERRFRIIGTRLAGDAGGLSPGVGECVRITTGAPMPAGADTVVIKEHVVEEAGSIIVRAG